MSEDWSEGWSEDWSENLLALWLVKVFPCSCSCSCLCYCFSHPLLAIAFLLARALRHHSPHHLQILVHTGFEVWMSRVSPRMFPSAFWDPSQCSCCAWRRQRGFDCLRQPVLQVAIVIRWCASSCCRFEKVSSMLRMKIWLTFKTRTACERSAEQARTNRHYQPKVQKNFSWFSGVDSGAIAQPHCTRKNV